MQTQLTVDLNNLIRKYIGIPYKEKGNEEGFDCYELVRALYNEGLNLNMSAHVPDNTYKFFEYYCIDYGWDFPWDKLQQWDFLLIHPILHPVDHCGIVLNTTEFIHCISPPGVCISKIQQYRKRVYQILRPRIFGEEYDEQARALIEKARPVILRQATYEKELAYE